MHLATYLLFDSVAVFRLLAEGQQREFKTAPFQIETWRFGFLPSHVDIGL